MGASCLQGTSPEIIMMCRISSMSKGNVWLRLLELQFLALCSQQQIEWKAVEVLNKYSVLKKNHLMEWSYLTLSFPVLNYLFINFKEVISNQQRHRIKELVGEQALSEERNTSTLGKLQTPPKCYRKYKCLTNSNTYFVHR